MPQKKVAKGKKAAKVKDLPARSLKAKDASKVKGGLNPQPEPPAPTGFLKIEPALTNPFQLPNVIVEKH